MMLPKTLRLAMVLVLGMAGASMTACGPSNNNNNGDGGTGGDSGNTGGDGGGNVTPAQQCTNVLNAYCDKINTCAPALLALEYGDVATCKTALGTTCAGYTGPGLTNPSACVSTITSASCDDLFTVLDTAPAACQEVVGTGAAASSCTHSYECAATLYCDTSGSSGGDAGTGGDAGVCPQGVCTATLAAGASCATSGTCDGRTGARCVQSFSATSSTGGDGAEICQAVTYGGVGAQCASSTNKQCNGATYCTGAHTCAALLTSGAACDPQASDSGCDIRQGLVCQQATGDAGGYTCQPLMTAAIGAACGFNGTTFVLCVASGYCDMGDAGFGSPGTCVTRKAQGASCTDDSQCTFGLHCASDTDPMPGTCQPQSASNNCG